MGGWGPRYLKEEEPEEAGGGPRGDVHTGASSSCSGSRLSSSLPAAPSPPAPSVVVVVVRCGGGAHLASSCAGGGGMDDAQSRPLQIRKLRVLLLVRGCKDVRLAIIETRGGAVVDLSPASLGAHGARGTRVSTRARAHVVIQPLPLLPPPNALPQPVSSTSTHSFLFHTKPHTHARTLSPPPLTTPLIHVATHPPQPFFSSSTFRPRSCPSPPTHGTKGSSIPLKIQQPCRRFVSSQSSTPPPSSPFCSTSPFIG